MESDKGRYIYHYCAMAGNASFSGIAQLGFRIISQNDLDKLKGLINTAEFTCAAITSLSYLGREFE